MRLHRCPHCAQPVTLFRTRTPILSLLRIHAYVRVCVNHSTTSRVCTAFVLRFLPRSRPFVFRLSSVVSSDCQPRHRSHSPCNVRSVSTNVALHHADNASPPLRSLRVRSIETDGTLSSLSRTDEKTSANSRCSFKS